MNSLLDRPRRRAKNIVNIIPLIDVLTVLIFFFLVSMQFRNPSTLNIVFPKLETAGANRSVRQIEVAVDSQGRFYYNGAPLAQKEMVAAIETAAAANKDVPVLLMADENSQFKNVTIVIDTCRRVGLEKVRLESRQ